MNNIDILEEYLDKQDRKYVSEYRLMILKAIETVIAENKELKEKNEYLKSQIPVDKIFYYSYKDFIPKSKVEMEIHDIDNWLEGGRYIHYGLNPYELEAQKKVLQSLLGKE